MRASFKLLYGLLAGFLVFACGGTEPEDGADDSFLTDGKADVVGGVTIYEGSGEACGVLRLASEASAELLDKGVGLDSRAAANILEHREGPDGQPGTHDDERFDSLAELDAVKYVGSRAFAKLLTYAQDNDYPCRTIDVQVLSLSDWHGQLDPVFVYDAGNFGGAEVLSTYFLAERKSNPNTLLLSAGDSFGGSPPLSSFFEEQPTVEAMNLMRFSASITGNHEFDRGVSHLQSIIDQAWHPYLAANLDNVGANMSCPNQPGGDCVRPFTIFPVGGVRVAVIGVLTPEAPMVVKPGNFGTIEVTDPVEAALEARYQAAMKGAQMFVAVAHIGANGGEDPTGPLVEFARQAPGFDLVIGGHTHNQVNHLVDGVPVVQTPSGGGSYARSRLTYDFVDRRLVDQEVEVIPTPNEGLLPDPAMVDLLTPYRDELSAIFDDRIAEVSGIFERGDNIERLGEVPIGNLIADAVREAYGVDVGFINGGGIRAPLPSGYAPADFTLRRPGENYAAGPPYDLVVGDVYAVLPFGNVAVTRKVTGAQLWEMLEHSVGFLPDPKGSFAQVSGIRFEFDSSAPAGSRVVSVTFDDGSPVPDDGTEYTMATSDFLAAGGDGYSMLADGDGVSRDKLAEVVLGHIRSLGNLVPAVEGRIVDRAGQ